MLRTSLNIHFDVLDRISAAAVRLDIPRREVIIRLLMRVVRDHHRYPGGFSLVKYQGHDPEKRWHCFPMYYSKAENELVTDLRKFGKFTVSKFVAIAVYRYLDEIVQEIEVGRYNYVRPSGWSLGQKLVSGSICWEICWKNKKQDRNLHKQGTILRSIGMY
ncbi:MAG: hypothetical protein EPN93_12485 [Spirochaetes bacterium]|nr:MAG: hypothetical protein EPN93_12485 [Spirochaetota bacterium]